MSIFHLMELFLSSSFWFTTETDFDWSLWNCSLFCKQQYQVNHYSRDRNLSLQIKMLHLLKSLNSKQTFQGINSSFKPINDSNYLNHLLTLVFPHSLRSMMIYRDRGKENSSTFFSIKITHLWWRKERSSH